jgi:hypothetical protein
MTELAFLVDNRSVWMLDMLDKLGLCWNVDAVCGSLADKSHYNSSMR